MMVYTIFRYSFTDIFHYPVPILQNICNAALWKAKLLQPIFDLSRCMLNFRCETNYWNPTSNDLHTCMLIFLETNRLGWDWDWGWGWGVYLNGG
jgi:hypothetical protein